MLIETLESISWVEPILCVIRDDLENPPSFTDVNMGDFVTRWADVEGVMVVSCHYQFVPLIFVLKRGSVLSH